MAQTLHAGDRVRFQAPLSDGGTARWTSVIVKIAEGIAWVRHPARARTFPFSPVQTPGLYRYATSKLNKAVR